VKPSTGQADLLFGAAPERIRVERSNRDPGAVVIRVGRRRAAEIPAETAEALGACDGAPWTDALASAVADAARVEKAKRRALSLLARRACARSRLLESLRRAGHDASAAERAVAALEADGLVDDHALARDLVEAELRRRPVGAARLEQRLLARGLNEDAARDAVREAMEQRDQTGDALQAAQRRLRTLPASISPAAAARRLDGHLARLGFEEEDRRLAVESAVNAGAAGER